VKSRRALAILFVIVFVDLVGFGMVLPLMPLYAKHLGAPKELIGLLGTGYSLMQLVFSPIWGRLSDRYGRRRSLLLSIAMTSVAFAAYGFADSFAVLLVARLFAGAATANIAIAQAYVADVTTPEARAKGMGIIGAAFGLGFVIGPAVGSFLSQWSLGAPSIAAAVLAAVNGVVAFFVLVEPPQRTVPVRRGAVEALLDEILRPGVRRLLLCYFVTILAFSIMEATYALLAADHFAVPEREIAKTVGWLFTFIGVLMVIVQGGLVGPLTRRFGETKLLLTGMLLQAGALAALPFASGTWGFLAATAPLAIGSGLASPAMSALLSRHGPADDQGERLGIGQSAAALGRVVGPWTGTETFTHLGPPVPYLAAAALMTVATVIGATVRPPRGS
jgi:DHA1 family tetracycline resistance protein-like MFS transporter